MFASVTYHFALVEKIFTYCCNVITFFTLIVFGFVMHPFEIDKQLSNSCCGLISLCELKLVYSLILFLVRIPDSLEIPYSHFSTLRVFHFWVTPLYGWGELYFAMLNNHIVRQRQFFIFLYPSLTWGRRLHFLMQDILHWPHWNSLICGMYFLELCKKLSISWYKAIPLLILKLFHFSWVILT